MLPKIDYIKNASNKSCRELNFLQKSQRYSVFNVLKRESRFTLKVSCGFAGSTFSSTTELTFCEKRKTRVKKTSQTFLL